MEPVRQQHILVGIETDPVLYHGEQARRPALLDSSQVSQILAHAATDLAVLLPFTEQCTLSMAGALFNQAQVLRPQLPVFEALESLWQSSGPGKQTPSRLLAFGVEDKRMPRAELQPDRDITPGTLQLLPCLLSCPANSDTELETGIDRLFAEQGQLSSAAVGSLQEHFQIAIKQARFMTLTQLGELLQRQLEHYGFLPLWELLDAAMSSNREMLEVRTALGLKFKWREGAVHGYFESFDWWANYGSGVNEVASGQQLQTAYAEWTREYRRYQSILGAHGIEFAQHLPGLEDAVLDGSFFQEESTVEPDPQSVSITEHSAGELGTVVVTVVNCPRQINLYPLQADGINDLHRYIREHDFGGDIAYPGHIRYDEVSRQLIAETLPS